MLQIRRKLGHRFKFKICKDSTPYAMPIIGQFNDIDERFERRIQKYLKVTKPNKKTKKLLLIEFTGYLAEVIDLINGIHRHGRREFGEKVKAKNYIVTEKFKERSSLDWNDHNAYDIDHINFKLKFLTLILSIYIQDTDTYLERLDVSNTLEYEYLVKLISNFRKCIPVYISSTHYKNALICMQQKIVVINSIDDPDSINAEVNEMISNINTLYKKSIFGNSFTKTDEEIDDDVIIDCIIKLAFLVSTNNMNFRTLPKFKTIEGLEIGDEEISSLIKQLGRAIIESHSKKTYPDMFASFMLANPEIYIKGAKKNEVMMGRLALNYTKMICNNPIIDIVIDTMIEGYRE